MRVDDNLASVIVGGLFFMIPIIALLTRHQLKMTQILNANSRPREDEALIQELRELRSLVSQQALMIDSLNTSQRELIRRLPDPAALPERLNA